jgi:DNA-binding NarL/FixJ family response regulator
MIRLVVADDHPIVRWGLVTLLGEQPGAEVVGEATDGFEAIELTRTLRPDVVVLDVSMPGCNGIKATSLLHRSHPGVRVVLVSALGWPSMPAAARLAGAHRYVAKSAPAAELLAAVFG